MAEPNELRIKFLRGTAVLNDGYTGPAGEFTIDTTNWTVRVHDGATPGGHPQANEQALTTLVSGIGSNVSLMAQRVEALETLNIGTLAQRVQTLETLLTLMQTKEYIDLEVMSVEIKSILRELEFWAYRIQALRHQLNQHQQTLT
jgi:hypothetical protein